MFVPCADGNCSSLLEWRSRFGSGFRCSLGSSRRPGSLLRSSRRYLRRVRRHRQVPRFRGSQGGPTRSYPILTATFAVFTAFVNPCITSEMARPSELCQRRRIAIACFNDCPVGSNHSIDPLCDLFLERSASGHTVQGQCCAINTGTTSDFAAFDFVCRAISSRGT